MIERRVKAMTVRARQLLLESTQFTHLVFYMVEMYGTILVLGAVSHFVVGIP